MLKRKEPEEILFDLIAAYISRSPRFDEGLPADLRGLLDILPKPRIILTSPSVLNAYGDCRDDREDSIAQALFLFGEWAIRHNQHLTEGYDVLVELAVSCGLLAPDQLPERHQLERQRKRPESEADTMVFDHGVNNRPREVALQWTLDLKRAMEGIPIAIPPEANVNELEADEKLEIRTTGTHWAIGLMVGAFLAVIIVGAVLHSRDPVIVTNSPERPTTPSPTSSMRDSAAPIPTETNPPDELTPRIVRVPPRAQKVRRQPTRHKQVKIRKRELIVVKPIAKQSVDQTPLTIEWVPLPDNKETTPTKSPSLRTVHVADEEIELFFGQASWRVAVSD